MAISRSDMERQLRNMGGIMSLQEPRQGYFLGDLVKKAKRAVKKVVKSPIGKAAILGGLTFGIPGTQFSGLVGKGGIGSFFGKGSFNPLKSIIEKRGFGALTRPSGLAKLLGKFGLAEGTKLTGLGKIAGIGGLSGLAGLMASGEEDEDEIDFSKLDRGEGLDIDRIVRLARQNDSQFRFLPGAEFTGAYAEGGKVNLEKDPEYKGWKKMYMINPDAAESHPKHTEFENYLKSKENKKAEGGMSLTDKQLEIIKEGGPKIIGLLADADKMMGTEGDRLDMALQMLLRDNKDNELLKYALDTAEERGTTKLDVLMDLIRSQRISDISAFDRGKKSVVDKISVKDLARKEGSMKDGGLMSLGGMEMDLRGGGFVPIGAKEKADDVPARLSKNEFVMTADAVRAAGGGSVDKGADKMYKMMKNLEAQV